MKTSELSHDEIIALTTFMLAQQQRDLPRSYLSRELLYEMSQSDAPEQMSGDKLFAAYCAACHGSNGEGIRGAGTSSVPAIGSPDFLTLATDDLILETIRNGRPGTRMPAWREIEGGLRESEIQLLVVHLRTLSGGIIAEPDTKPARWANGDVATGSRLYTTYCSGCHGAQGRGAEGPALNNPVLLSTASDTFLFETIRRGRRGTTMESFERVSLSHPALTPEEIESIVTHIRQWEQLP